LRGCSTPAAPRACRKARAHARNLWAQTLAYFADIDKLGPGDAVLHAAPLSTAPALRPAALRRRRGERDPGKRPLRAAGDFALLDHWPNLSFFAAPTMIVRLLSSAARARRAT